MTILFLLKIIFLSLGVLGWQKLVREVIKQINKKIEISMKKVEEYATKENFNFKNLKENEIEPFFLIKIKKEDLSFLTIIIGYLEIFIFFIFTFILLQHNFILSNLDTIKIIGIITSGWIGLKILGNYQQWSNPVFGRALFYNFFISSLVNITGGIIFGYIFFKFFFA